MTYAGIGSRETTPTWRTSFQNIGSLLAFNGFTLRSGGAAGADKAFENGCDSVFGNKEIFYTYKVTYRKDGGAEYDVRPLNYISPDALAFVDKYHPAPHHLTDGGKLLMARNTYQVLGLDLMSPVDFVICWTPLGRDDGGTGQAIRIANAHNIPVYNTRNKDAVEALLSILGR